MEVYCAICNATDFYIFRFNLFAYPLFFCRHSCFLFEIPKERKKFYISHRLYFVYRFDILWSFSISQGRRCYYEFCSTAHFIFYYRIFSLFKKKKTRSSLLIFITIKSLDLLPIKFIFGIITL